MATKPTPAPAKPMPVPKSTGKMPAGLAAYWKKKGVK